MSAAAMIQIGPLRRLLHFLLAVALLVTCGLPAAALSEPLPAAFSTPITLDISNLKPFLDTLPPDEQAEQLRDWALYGVRNILALTTSEEMPIRHPALKEAFPGEVSPGRVFQLSATAWGVVAAPELLEDKPWLGGLIDGKYATCNRLPETIALFSYSADPALATIRIAFAGSLRATDLFTPEYGYHSATIRTLADFTDFAAGIDDVVSFQWRADSVSIGGRKYTQDTRRALTLEDLAGLYQAFAAPGATGEVDLGFSLDQKLHYQGLGEDLQGLEGVPGVAAASADPAFAALLSKHHADFLTCGARLKNQQDLRPFLALQSRYEGAQSAPEARLRSLLRYLAERNSYQAARYDGKLQGTSVGMILFYTDLLAKLWLLDFDDIAPRSVVGFRTTREIKVPRLYWDDFLQRTATRLWFGLRGEGFEFYGNHLLFQPLVTRVYAASYDPALPGKEGRPNYLNREFLGWWDRHYEALAAAEPYYHKLTQIQKWSCIFMALQEDKAHHLDFLMDVPVRRGLDFAEWNRTEATASKISIPFLDKRTLGATTECLPLLSSQTFPLMGKTYLISGGVSLAARKDILAKMRRHAPQGKRIRALGEEARWAGTGSGSRNPSGPKARALASRPVRLTNRGGPSLAGNYGTFAAEKGAGTIRLRWAKGSGLAPHELVESLAAWQEAHPPGLQGEEMFRAIADIQSVVRVKERQLYLVKTVTTKEAWISLAINPPKAEKYPARASGAFREADIFAAKLIPAADARTLAAGKVVR